MVKKSTKLIKIIFSIFLLFTFIIGYSIANPCNEEQKSEIKNNNLSESVIFPKGDKADSSIFTGNAWVEMMVNDKDDNCWVYNVTFEPGARNYWHAHPCIQILMVTGGEGYYQEEGKAARLLHPGDVVKIPPGVKHWHGATKNSWFVHLGITTDVKAGPTEWFEKVEDKEYNKLEVEVMKTEKNENAVTPDCLTFTLTKKVTAEKVSFKNKYGITVAGHLYVSKDIDKSKKYPALVIGTPYGGVKEQGAGIYAQNMAERGFVSIAFDESYNGESSGEPRHISSPDLFVEDFSAAVDFIGTLPFVDRDKIGAIGICGSGGFAVTAAQVDYRIKAVATASMYDMSRVMRKGWKDGMTDEEVTQTFIQLGEQRWKDFENGSPELTPQFPDEIPEEVSDPISAEFMEYYVASRGHHPNSIGAFSITSSMSFMNFPLMNYIDTISPRPILFIIGENAHSRYFSEDAYKMAAETKELYIVPGARHIDLYDRTDMIPFDKLEEFFSKYLEK